MADPVVALPAGDSVTTILQRFKALTVSEGLKKRSKQYKKRQSEFIIGEVRAGFKTIFGGTASSLQAWQSLCKTVGIEGTEKFTAISQCKASLKGKYVNIVDLVDAALAGKVMTMGVFGNKKELVKYIRGTGKRFPGKKARVNPLLSRFLIRVW